MKILTNTRELYDQKFVELTTSTGQKIHITENEQGNFVITQKTADWEE